MISMKSAMKPKGVQNVKGVRVCAVTIEGSSAEAARAPLVARKVLRLVIFIVSFYRVRYRRSATTDSCHGIKNRRTMPIIA